MKLSNELLQKIVKLATFERLAYVPTQFILGPLEHETFNKIRFSNEEYEVVVSDDINKGFYYISIYEKKTETTIVIADKII